MTSISLRPPMSVPTDASPQSAKTRAVVSPWTWMAVTCLLLGLSGGIRFWRESKFSALAVESAACPFPLAELPRTMGTWQATDKSEVQLDPEVVRFAGASEHIVRNYLDQKTGEQASVLVLYGLGTARLRPHPGDLLSGRRLPARQGPDRSLDRGAGREGPRALPLGDLHRSGWAASIAYEEVYHTFLHHGDWMPDAAGRWKMFRYYPGLFKIQIAHPISSLNEDGEGPCLSLLTEFVRQINERLPAAPAGRADGGIRPIGGPDGGR